MAKKPATLEEKAYMNAVAQLGCLICRQPAELHHVRNNTGIGLRPSHYNVIPLCHCHHRTNNFGHAVHNGVKTFEANYGTQQEMLERVRNMLDV